MGFFLSRSSLWWDRIVLETFGENDWIENFSMGPYFLYLCDKLKASISWHDTCFRKAITIHQHVTITLCCLATSCEYRTIAHLGIAQSTVCEILVMLL